MIKNTFNIIKFFIFSLIVIPAMSFSAPLFDPGETLDPGCLPSDPDCTVSTSSASLLYPSFTYASSTFPSFEYASTTYYLASNPDGFLTIVNASSSFPTFSYASSTYALLASSTQWTTSGSNIFYNTGNVGIGTSTPNSALTVIGTSTTDRLEITDGIYYAGGTSLAFGSTTIGSYYFADAGNSSSTGGANIAMGPGALYLNTSGGGNMAFGSSSLYSNINGGGNIAFGTDALFSNISGGGNIAFGPQALYSNISGGGNMAFGSAALASNISGGGNYAFGQGALYMNTTGGGNLAFGAQALNSNTEGHANVAFGNGALSLNATGSANTAIGPSSLSNFVFGYENTALGYNSGSNLVTGTGNIFIGNNTLATNTVSSNFLNIGNLIYGDRTSGKVGIGTSTPTANLTASGTIRFTSLGSAGGNLVTDTDGNITVSSDERLKDIQSNYEGGLADIQKIVPINYKWKPETGYETTNVYTGFSAQNLSIAIPEAVATSSSGYLTIADRPILAALVNAIKDIGSFINKIENGIAYLKNVVVERFAVGSSVSPEGITMYDKTTKQPYCVVINNGVLSNEPGECISSNLENTATVEMPEIIMGDLIIEDSTILDGEATTTNEILEGTSTTTDPILDETVEGTSTTTNEEEIISTSTEEIIIEEPIIEEQTEEAILDSSEQSETTPIE